MRGPVTIVTARAPFKRRFVERNVRLVAVWRWLDARHAHPGAPAQQSTLYDAKTGKVVGRSATDSAGSTVIYDAQGRIIARESTDSAGTKTIYDAKSGKIIGRESPQR